MNGNILMSRVIIIIAEVIARRLHIKLRRATHLLTVMQVDPRGGRRLFLGAAVGAASSTSPPVQLAEWPKRRENGNRRV